MAEKPLTPNDLKGIAEKVHMAKDQEQFDRVRKEDNSMEGKKEAKGKAKKAPPPAGSGAKLKRKEYEKELRRLQTELCLVQDWVKATGQRIVIVFEGRDAAGKGGTIRAITERC